MSRIDIHLLDGTHAGAGRTLQGDRLTFGRTPDNAIVIDVPHVSRRHGGLEYREGQWHVISVSPNGTTVNGRAIAEKTPHPLNDGDTIGVGKRKLFTVGLRGEGGQAGTAAGSAMQPHDAPEPAHGMDVPSTGDPIDTPPDRSAKARKRKSALYIGIGVYVVLTLVGGYILSQMMTGGADAQAGPPEPMSEREIERIIEQPIDMRTSDVRKERFLQDARRAAARRDANPTALWEAYINYKRAVAAAEDGRLGDPVAERAFDTIEREMIDKVQQMHKDAYALIRAGRFEDARASLDRLTREVYQNQNSRLGRYLRNLRAYADARTAD